MPVNYIKLRGQVKSLGEKAKTRQEELDHKLDAARSILEMNAQETKEMQRLVEAAITKNKVLRCAVPVEELLNTHVPVSLPAPACTILSADGSQIIPDPHDTVLYGLINIGLFRIRPGSGETPAELTKSTLLFDDDLYTQAGLVSEELISLLRDVSERQILAELAKLEPKPVITLTDGPLELYHEPRQEKRFESEFNLYLAALDDLADNEVITAGYVSRPRADLVVNLLSLAGAEKPDDPNARLFAGITDTLLLGDFLAPGERSAIFRLQSKSSKDYEGRKELHFFYLNVGRASQPAYARVEIPLWVAENPESITLLHAVLVDQSSRSGTQPYPYPLIRAHEIAVVTRADHDELTAMIGNELLRQGFRPGRKSEKQSHKEHLGRTRL